MGFIDSVEQTALRAEVEWTDFDPLDPFWYNDVGSSIASASGRVVTGKTALRLSAVFACARVLAEDMAKVPIILYRRRGDDGRERATDHPLYRILAQLPNRWQTSYTWRELLQGHMGVRGNGYARIEVERGEVSGIVPLRPDRMKVEQLENTRLRYTYSPPGGGEQETYSQDEIFHPHGFSTDGIVGLSPIGLAREAIGLGLSYEEYSARFFDNNAEPGVALTTDQKLGPDKRKELSGEWNKNHQGASRAHKTAVLDMGLDIKTIGLSARDAQFIESRKFQTEEIARFYRVPPHKIGVTEQLNYSNMETMERTYVQDSLMAWARRWEEAIFRDLLTPEEQDEYFVEFLFDALLRGDTKDRYEAHNLAIFGGWKSRNEIRKTENLPPGPPELDEFLEPRNITGNENRSRETGGGPQEPEGMDAAVVEILAEDAADRIAGAEIGVLERRAPKAAEDRGRFDAWVTDVYDAHADYVARNVEPLAQVVGLESTDGLVQRITRDGREAVHAADDVPALMSEWREGRATDISEIILEECHGD